MLLVRLAVRVTKEVRANAGKPISTMVKMMGVGDSKVRPMAM
jgi:hypothetical protein